MTIWTSYLVFKDLINDKKIRIKFKHEIIYTYKSLYDNLEKLFQDIGWKQTYSSSWITFKLGNHTNKPIRIIDWNKYILNKDKIYIILFNPSVHSYGLFNQKGDKLIETSNAKTIYQDIKIELIKEPLYLYQLNACGTKTKLIDVIDNPKRCYNEVVNRLILNYGW